jgi:hypothetical protein
MNMNDYIRKTGSHVSKATSARDFHTFYAATWRGRAIYEEFGTEREAWNFLSASDAAGQIVNALPSR